MAATEKPVTELTPKTNTSALTGKAIVTYSKSDGSADAFDGDRLKTMLDNFALKDPDAVPGHLAEFDENGNPVDSGRNLTSIEGDIHDLEDNKLDRLDSGDGGIVIVKENGMVEDSGVPVNKISDIEKEVSVLSATTGISEGIADTISAGTPQEFVFRQSGGDGVNYMKRIKGCTKAINQLVNPSTAEASKTESGITFTKNADGSISVSGTATAQVTYLIGGYTVISGHTYFMKGCPAGGSANTYTLYLSDSGVAVSEYGGGILVTATQTGYVRIRIVVPQGSVITTAVTFRPKLTDLTLAGFADYTLAQILALYPNGFGAYNPGSLESNDASALETTGINQFDDSTLIRGKWRSPENVEQDNDTRWRSDVFFPCLPNKDYYLGNTVSNLGNFASVVCWYDANKNFIIGNSGNGTTIVTAPANAAYFRMSGAEMNANAIPYLNLSNPAINGQYEPYWKRTIHLGLNNIRVKSHNIWDEEWEVGVYSVSTGAKDDSSTTNIRTKNLVPVIPGASYYLGGGYLPTGSTFRGRILFYGVNGEYLNNTANPARQLTIASNCYFINFYTQAEYGTTYNHDICINVSATGINGKYFPYGEDGILTYNCLDGAGTAFDFVFKDANGIQKLQKTMLDEVDLGDLTWGYDTSGIYPFFQASVNNMGIARTLPANVANILCSKYAPRPATVDVGGANGIGAFSSGANSYVRVYDSAYTDAATFKAAMAGVKLIAEAATPIEYELAEPMPNAILVDELGTEKAIFHTHEDGSPSAPLCTDSNYSISVSKLVSIVKSLSNESNG